MTENVLVKFPDPPPPNAHIELVDERLAKVDRRYAPDFPFNEGSSNGRWRCVTNGERGYSWHSILIDALQECLSVTWRIPPIEVREGQVVQVKLGNAEVYAGGTVHQLPDGGIRVVVETTDSFVGALNSLASDGVFSVRQSGARVTEEIKRTLETDHQIPPSEAELDAVAALGYDRETFRAPDGTFDATSTDLTRRRTAAKLGVARAKVHGTDPALTSLPDDDAAGDWLARRPIKDNPQA